MKILPGWTPVVEKFTLETYPQEIPAPFEETIHFAMEEEVDEQEELYVKVFETELKKHRCVTVCGRRDNRKRFFVVSKEFEEEKEKAEETKRFKKDVLSGQLYHDRTKILIPNNVRKVANKQLRDKKKTLEEKVDQLEKVVREVTENT